MSNLPEYFYRIFQAVKRLDEYLDINMEALDILEVEKDMLDHLTKSIIVVIPKDLNSIYNPIKFDDSITDLDGILLELCQLLVSHWKYKNTLTSGYYIATGGWINEKFRDTTIKKIKEDKAWQVLLNCIGKEKTMQTFT